MFRANQCRLFAEPVQKPIPDQIKLITEKWDPSNPNCVFRTYLYNKVEEHAVPHYHPGPQDDPKEWDEALRNKPAANFMPVLCAGFPAIVARLTLQRRALAEFNNKLHAINASLDAILSRHDLEHSVRALNARRKHAEQSRRCLVLAAKVQILRNRGYALSGDEDQLKQKLQKIDKDLQDPALSARLEELWSRLIILRQYADSLKDEINKPGALENGSLSEDVEAKAKKVGVFPLQSNFETPGLTVLFRSSKTTTSNFSTLESRLRKPRRTLTSGKRNISQHRLRQRRHASHMLHLNRRGLRHGFTRLCWFSSLGALLHTSTRKEVVGKK